MARSLLTRSGVGTVAEILGEKGTAIHIAERRTSVFDAIQRMVAHKVGSLVVVDGGEPCGIVTERDYLKRVAAQGLDPTTTLVEEVMTAEVVCVRPSDTFDRCMALMTELRIRHLPVLADGRLVGLVSVGDLVKRQVLEQRIEIQYLTDYITS